jgi:hypothetical protein
MTSEPEIGQSKEAARRGGLSRASIVWLIVVGIGLIAWFFFAWLVLDRHLLDAAGESIGTALVLLVIVSVMGAVWRNRPKDG